MSNLSSPTRPSPTKSQAPIANIANPLPPPRLRAGLSRSLSAALPSTSSRHSIGSVTLPPISTLTRGLPPSLSRGRSRDVQAWESCADSERRDELTAQAENESNGSAIAAISLLRSTSSSSLASLAANSAPQPSSAKRNASVTRAPLRQVKKAKLSRANSTFARLEQVDSNSEKPRAHLNGKVKVSMLVTPNPDSDKENWSPDEDGQPRSPRRRPLPSFKAPVSRSPRRRPGGRILQEQGNRIPMLLNRANTAPSGDITIFEDGDGKGTADKFMPNTNQVSPSKRGDMDCVAGLLSLSQGAWR